MRKLKLNIGGHPLTGDDLLFLQDAVVENQSNFLNTFIGNNVILQGVAFTTAGTNTSWTAGYVYANNEVFEVTAGSVVAAGGLSGLYFSIVTTYDPAGNVVYEDLNLNNTYEIRKMTVIASGLGTPLPVLGFTRLDVVRLNNYIFNFSTTWFSVGANATAYQNFSREVCFSGNVAINNYQPLLSSPSNDLITTLPVGLRPQGDRILIAPAIRSSALVNEHIFVHVVIYTNGEVKHIAANSATTGYNVQIFLDGLRFSL